MKAFDNSPTASTYEIAKKTGYAQSTIYKHLHYKIGYSYRPIKRTPHQLDEGKKKRVIKSQQLLHILRLARRNHYRFLYTGDESWFFYDNQKDYMWIPPGEEPPVLPDHEFQAKKSWYAYFGIHMIY